jgi:hypothetical protein
MIEIIIHNMLNCKKIVMDKTTLIDMNNCFIEALKHLKYNRIG